MLIALDQAADDLRRASRWSAVFILTIMLDRISIVKGVGTE